MSSSSAGGSASSSLAPASASFDPSVVRRRIRSRARLRATVVSQASGASGTPARSHAGTASAKASAAHSSARSQSPHQAIRPATSRPQLSVKLRATASSYAGLIGDSAPQGAQLDQPALRHRVPRRDLDRVVEVVALEQVVAGDLLLGLGERPVEGDGPAVRLTDGDGPVGVL